METLLSLTLSGSSLALLLLALRYVVLKKLPSSVYYYAWLLVLLRFLLPLPGLIPTGQSTAAPAPTAQETPMLTRNRERVPSELPEDAWLPVTEAMPSTPAVQAALTPSEPPEAEADTPARPAIDWAAPQLWLAVWGLGAALSLGWPVLSYLRFTWSLRRMWQEPEDPLLALYASLPGRKPALYTCAALKTPLMFGVLSPRIILPAGVTNPATLENILRHELTHYRRKDPLYKWFATAVLALHWFNPLAWLIRRELNRACELSCDETLLRSMDRAQKQAYGETLLRMAASSALPAGVVATTFSTEKRNLKERLEQIMHYKKSKGRVLAAVLALLLLCGCGAVAGPAEDAGTDADIVPADAPEPTPSADGTVVQVSDVDGLLAAITPNTTIELAPGIYDLSTASDYGADASSEYYSWNRLTGEAPNSLNYELEIHNVEGLSLRGAGMEETTVSAEPRYANVIRFERCRNVTVSALTAGHTEAPGICSGGVLRFDACNDIAVDGCGLFGCGTIGVWAQNCTGLTVTDSRIYECSYAAVDVSSCRDVLVQGCEIDRNGVKIEGSDAVNLFSASNSDGFAVVGCRIHDNRSQKLLTADYTKNALFLSNHVEDNRIPTCLFQVTQYPVTVDGCAFTGNDAPIWIRGNGVFPVDAEGNALDAEALAAMEYRKISPESVQAAKPRPAAAEVPVGGSVTVQTVDELLAAIGPDRTIVLDGALFDLSTASDYGGFGGEYYYWREVIDGPELVINGVSGLTILAAGDDPKDSVLVAVPRYANVLRFQNCDNISLMGFTAGHTEEPIRCAGAVLSFTDCHGIDLAACSLYGCGTLGVSCESCTGFTARDCEIYACSQGGVSMSRTDGIRFLNCDIHDVPSPALRFSACGDKSWDGEAMMGERFDLDGDGRPVLLDIGPLLHESIVFGPVEPEELVPFEAPYTFAQSMQELIADGDWEALADQLLYPFVIYSQAGNYVFDEREAFLRADLDTILNADFRARIAAAPLYPFGLSAVGGNSFCENHLALVRLQELEGKKLDELRLLCISMDGPLTQENAIGIFYYDTQETEFTLHVGDTVTLDAKLFPEMLYPDADCVWSVSDADTLRLTPSADGHQCTLEALKAAPGGVTLRLKYEGSWAEARVYIAAP